jgi:hypothetical protein
MLHDLSIDVFTLRYLYCKTTEVIRAGLCDRINYDMINMNKLMKGTSRVSIRSWPFSKWDMQSSITENCAVKSLKYNWNTNIHMRTDEYDPIPQVRVAQKINGLLRTDELSDVLQLIFLAYDEMENTTQPNLSWW